jgi:hypothetical protein
MEKNNLMKRCEAEVAELSDNIITFNCAVSQRLSLEVIKNLEK